MAAINADRVWFIVRGMAHYVSRIYKNEKKVESSSEISEEDLYLPRKLKTVLSHALDRFKNEKFVTAHNHVVHLEDREEHLKKSFRAGLLEVAVDRRHTEFLRECALYVISATELEVLGFPEAQDIVMDAIYQACMNTIQHESLILWGAQVAHTENSVIKNLSNHIPQSNHYGNNEVSSSDKEMEVNIEF